MFLIYRGFVALLGVIAGKKVKRTEAAEAEWLAAAATATQVAEALKKKNGRTEDDKDEVVILKIDAKLKEQEAAKIADKSQFWLNLYNALAGSAGYKYAGFTSAVVAFGCSFAAVRNLNDDQVEAIRHGSAVEVIELFVGLVSFFA
ncbi:MAG: hypothetical protein ACRDD1_18165 [Planctomycetia bacterium]